MNGYKSRLLAWGVGQADRGVVGDACGTVVLENDEHVDVLFQTGLVDGESLVFAPDSGPARMGADRPGVIRYAGSIADSGSEFSVDDEFFLQIQAYGISEFMSVVGPTLVRIADRTDFEVFLADADRAWSDGTFPAFLTNPVVHLADLTGLGADVAADGPAFRLHVAVDGRLSTSPGGSPLGRLGESTLPMLRKKWARLNADSAAPCAVCLGAVVNESDRCAQLSDRPWLGRYLAALSALRGAATRGATGVRVSGFGGWAVADLGGVPPIDDVLAPLVLFADDAAYLHEPRSGRTFRLDHRAAGVLEVLVACGGVGPASRFVSEDLLHQGELMLARSGVRLPTRPEAVLG